jgi:hypothetical protein
MPNEIEHRTGLEGPAASVNRDDAHRQHILSKGLQV